jgi:pyridoxal phosphate enzyme (YggS family)
VAIAENIAALETRIRAACDRAGRERDSVTLVAVSKTHPPELVDEAARAGLTDFGENRVQEAAGKIPAVAADVSWHLIGHLQTNKAKKALELFPVIHSVDSTRLAEALQTRCEQADRTVRVLAEVNTSGEESKFGVDPTGLPELADAIAACGRLEFDGLMTIGPGWAVTDPEASRPCFKTLARLAEETRQRLGIPLPNLSMGMSADFEQGIEEGSTIVRVGTAIFGPRPCAVR